MPNLWDLPKAVRKKIYRLHLVQDEPITYQEFKAFCGCTERDDRKLAVKRGPKKIRTEIKLMPRLLEADRKIEREASQIFFGENSFVFCTPSCMDSWVKRLWHRHLNLIRSMILDDWYCAQNRLLTYSPSYDVGFQRLGRLKSLQSLTIMMDEAAVLNVVIRRFLAMEFHSSLGYGPQINLKLLNLNGMASFRSLSGLRHLEALKFNSSITQVPKQLGTMDGGLLESIIKQEVMRPRSGKP